MILEEDKVRTIILSIDFHLMEECHKVLIEAEGKILGLFAQIITRKLRSTKKKSELKRMSNSKLCCCEIRLKRKKIRKLLVRDQQQKGRNRKPKSKNVTDDSSTTSWILCDAVIGLNLVARNSRSEYLSF